MTDDQGRFWGKLDHITVGDVDLRRDDEGMWTVRRGEVVQEVKTLDEALAMAWKLLDEGDEE